MCGIEGVFGRHEPDVVAEMLATLVHRGPDDRHQIGGGGFTFGACRLSIQDLAHGRQPMQSQDQKICAMQNGEIYNAPELSKELEKRGYRFQGHCDTEVLAPLYQEYGEEAWSRLEGMFAVALWDQNKERGYLIRDRCGKKPLYYTLIKGLLYFASEIKALLMLRGCSREPNREATIAYLGLKHIPGTASPYQAIRQIPPGHSLVWDGLGQGLKFRKYWTFPSITKKIDDPNQVVSKFLDLLRKAVHRRLLSDVPVGFFLSGGLDSSLVVALAAEVSNTPLKTFTLTLEEKHKTPGKEADKFWARYVAKRYGTEHREHQVKVENLGENLLEILRAFDEPFAGVISPYFLAREMTKHVKVALCGDGADELLGSYLSHRLAASLEDGSHAYIRTAKENEIFSSQGSTKFKEWRAGLEVFTHQELQSLINPEFAGGLLEENRAEKNWDEACTPFAHQSPLNQTLSAECVTLLPDQILKYADRLSMAHSLEVRSPFLDQEVVEFVASLPADWKIRGQETKYLVKQAAKQYFPEEMITRKKEGFLMPIAQWVHGPLKHEVEKYLTAKPLLQIIKKEKLRALRDKFEEESKDKYRTANKIYSLLILSMWLEEKDKKK